MKKRNLFSAYSICKFKVHRGSVNEAEIPNLLNRIQMFHTDRGSEFSNQIIDEVLNVFHISRSLSLKGCPYDNAVSESTFKILKSEFVFDRNFENLATLKVELADYINWFNNFGIHSSLGYLIPKELEASKL